jgi:hypothetical protein
MGSSCFYMTSAADGAGRGFLSMGSRDTAIFEYWNALRHSYAKLRKSQSKKSFKNPRRF